MNRYRGFAICLMAVLMMLSALALAGEPLVSKSADGKFVPAAASEWAKSGEHSFRFLLRAGSKAPALAAELKDKIAPITVKASDDLTLVFESPDLTETALLDKLSAIQLSGSQVPKDALAALSGMGNDQGPALNDLSSAGSIRASKKIDLPGAPKVNDPQTISGVVIKVCDCQPVPSLMIKVIAAGPKLGKLRWSFRAGQLLIVHGTFKTLANSQDIDPQDPFTQSSLAAKELKPGDKIFGKPLSKDGEEWVLESIQKM